MKRIGIFCGASTGRSKAYTDAAHETGRLLAQRGIEIVYGGAAIGLMGVVADAALSRGGRVTGVLPSFFSRSDLKHTGLTDLRIVPSMKERKELMIDLSDAFIALPGGIGTADEILEVWTLWQIGVIHKPCGLLNIEGFFDPFLSYGERMVMDGFLHPSHLAMVAVDSDPGGLLERLAAAPLESVPVRNI